MTIAIETKIECIKNNSKQTTEKTLSLLSYILIFFELINSKEQAEYLKLLIV